MTTNTIFKSFAFLIFSVVSTTTFAQTTTISKSLGLYVFPPDGKDAAAQDADEAACFKWAKEQTGYDPLNPTQVQAGQVDQSPDGSAVRGAARGAAAGAAIGAIAGDTGKGAAIGAVAGGLRGRRGRVARGQQQQQQANQAAASAEQNMAADYNKAFSVCMEGKGYTVK